ncbi:hypothetical protein ACDQ55_21225 [Chitinophaga sp. 30R24]|uniref:hypothetical protein n=1 Tax=Chitinophaga sp. 30R24 TaxID=3248838 RepID=UPI003B902EDA
MKNNVMAWETAITKGYQPKEYRFEAAYVPVGLVIARLDFKIWAKKVMGINGYFSQNDGKKFLLTVLLNPRLKNYQINKDQIDFSFCQIDCIYELRIGLRKEKITVEAIRYAEG